jgi:hypothetical protein
MSRLHGVHRDSKHSFGPHAGHGALGETPVRGRPKRSTTVSRRNVLRQVGAGVGVTLAGSALAACSADAAPKAQATAKSAAHDSTSLRPAGDPLTLLKEGNKRFVSGTMQHPNQDAARIKAVAAGQDPAAVVFCCVDSRISPVIVKSLTIAGAYFSLDTGEVSWT